MLWMTIVILQCKLFEDSLAISFLVFLIKDKVKKKNHLVFPAPNPPTSLHLNSNILPPFFDNWEQCLWFYLKTNPSLVLWIPPVLTYPLPKNFTLSTTLISLVSSVSASIYTHLNSSDLEKIKPSVASFTAKILRE